MAVYSAKGKIIILHKTVIVMIQNPNICGVLPLLLVLYEHSFSGGGGGGGFTLMKVFRIILNSGF